ncbi:hypothetical protein MMC07_001715 [Pseudocyphellaria aurata]|nr:hypothetical protein [Pseudocyphellaria aurata]
MPKSYNVSNANMADLDRTKSVRTHKDTGLIHGHWNFRFIAFYLSCLQENLDGVTADEVQFMFEWVKPRLDSPFYDPHKKWIEKSCNDADVKKVLGKIADAFRS